MSTQHDRLSAALADRDALEHELGAGGMATVYAASGSRCSSPGPAARMRVDLVLLEDSFRLMDEALAQ